MKVLAVDDSSENLFLLSSLLNDEGHRVIVGKNGEEAVSLFEREQPDLIILDVVMPVMDGHEAARRIKARATSRYVPIIFLTSSGDDESLAACLEAGGDDFISKPLSMAVLRSKIKAHGRIQSMSDEIAEKNQMLKAFQETVEREHFLAQGVFKKAQALSILNLPGVHYVNKPVCDFSGDLILGTPSARGGFFILLADFTGHGLPAAVGSLPVSQVFFETATQISSVGGMARAINKSLNLYLPPYMFAAATILEISPAGDQISFWNGGLPEVLVFQDGELSSQVSSRHMALGVLSDEEFEQASDSIAFGEGTRILVFSDGIVEVENASGEQFGQSRLEQAALKDPTAERFIDNILADNAPFRAGADFNDDVTILEINHYSGYQQRVA